MTARRLSSCGTSSARKSAGKAASSPSAAGSPSASPPMTPTIVPPTHASHRTMPGADQPVGIELAAALCRDRPRLVDDELRGEEAAERAARQEARDAHADRQVARVEQQRSRDRRQRARRRPRRPRPPRTAPSRRRSIALITTAGAGADAAPRRGQDAERDAEQADGDRQRDRGDRAAAQLEPDRRGLFHGAMLAATRAGAGSSPVRRRTA